VLWLQQGIAAGVSVIAQTGPGRDFFGYPHGDRKVVWWHKCASLDGLVAEICLDLGDDRFLDVPVWCQVSLNPMKT